VAIAITSDLVLDVVKAANPDRVRIAQIGLQRGRTAEKSNVEFAEAVNAVRHKAGIGRFLATDIVSDVVNAASPTRLKNSIMQLAGTSDPAKLDFANIVASTNDVEPGASNGSTKAMNPKEKAYQQFEATVLRNFVEEMLPKSAESVYGEGTAGNVWRSMQADFMSQELAKSGGVGIASTLAKMDEAKAKAQSGLTLNEISPSADGTGGSIVNSTVWPYFSRSKIGVFES
jgi:peptidoglycan hydrolase FlgJ